jgi:hypothetical protein
LSTKLAKLEGFHGSGAVRYKIDRLAGKTISATLAIDYSHAPVPEHYYVADFYQVVNKDPQVLIIFGKLNYPKADELRNRVEIYIPAFSFVNQFWKSRQEFHGILRQFVERFGYRPEPPGHASQETDKVQTLQSNNVYMIHSGGECMLDFFYLSPKDLYLKAPQGQEVGLEALVRVMVTPSLLLGFLDACEPIAESLRPKWEGAEAHGETVEPPRI